MYQQNNWLKTIVLIEQNWGLKGAEKINATLGT